MTSLTAEQRYLFEEAAEDYRDGRIGRREFVRQATLLVGASAALSLLAGCLSGEGTSSSGSGSGGGEGAGGSGSQAGGSQAGGAASPDAAGPLVPPDDPSIQAEYVEFPGEGATLRAYRADPAGGGGRGAGILVIHENRGLVPYTEDVARRLAKEGYVALAIDLVSRGGGTQSFKDPAEVTAWLGNASREELVADLRAGVAYLRDLPEVADDRVGAIGFCFGGGMAWLLAVREPLLRAVVPYYGPNPPLEEVPNIRAAVLGIYGAEDERIMKGQPDLEAALKQAGVTHEMRIYPGAQHAFHNNTGARYHPEAAAEAWKETLAWFDRHLQQPARRSDY